MAAISKASQAQRDQAQAAVKAMHALKGKVACPCQGSGFTFVRAYKSYHVRTGKLRVKLYGAFGSHAAYQRAAAKAKELGFVKYGSDFVAYF